MNPPAHPNLSQFIGEAELDRQIAAARDEDLGPHRLDVTSEVFIPANQRCEAQLNSRASGVLCGGALLPAIVRAYDAGVEVEVHRRDGEPLTPDACVATFRGLLRSVLAIERVALNYATHLSGVASRTARFVEQVQGTRARIYDTRKTIPGLRALQKYAVACGGGATHRIGLYDAMLIKDNHLAHLAVADLRRALADAVRRAHQQHPTLKFIEVEVDTLEQLEQVLQTGVDLVLLDNMTPATLRQAVAMRDAAAPGVELEASGGINLETIRAVAEAGVDRVSVGGLTHSAAALDLGLDIRER